MNFEFGLDTFGDITVDTQGQLLPHHQVLRNIVTEAELADQLGLDFFGVGEHHRPDFAVSAPEVVLARGSQIGPKATLLLKPTLTTAGSLVTRSRPAVMPQPCWQPLAKVLAGWLSHLMPAPQQLRKVGEPKCPGSVASLARCYPCLRALVQAGQEPSVDDPPLLA